MTVRSTLILLTLRCWVSVPTLILGVYPSHHENSSRDMRRVDAICDSALCELSGRVGLW